MGRNDRPDAIYDVCLGGLTHGLRFAREDLAVGAAHNLARDNSKPTQVVNRDTGNTVAMFDRYGQRLPDDKVSG